MKKTIVCIMLLLCLASTASAFVPLLIPAWVYGPTAAIAVSTAVVGLYYGMNSGTVPYVDVGANIKRASSAIFAQMQGGSAVLSTIAVDAKLTYAQLTALVATKPTLYPLLKDALNLTTAPLWPVDGGTMAVGSVFTAPVGGYNLRINTFLGQSTACAGGPPSYCGPANSYLVSGSFDGVPTQITVIKETSPNMFTSYDYLVSLGTVAPHVATVVEAPAILAAAGTSGPVKSAYYAELDKAMQDPSYTPSFSDTTTGLPWLPPSVVMTPDQLAVWNANGAAQQAREVAAAQAAAAAASALASANNAALRAFTALAVLNGDPTNPALIAEYDRLLALSEAANVIRNSTAVTSANILANNATLTAAAVTAAVPAVVPAPVVLAPASAVPVRPALKVISFAPFLALNGALSTTYPFNLPSSISNYFAVFKGTPVAPVFVLPVGLGQTMTVDLSVFDALAIMIRYMIGILVSVGIVFYLIHFYRGIS